MEDNQRVEKPKKLRNIRDAGRYIASILGKRGYTQIRPHLVNKGRHIILEAVAPQTGKLEVYYCLYKREFFHSYNRHFKDTEGEGFGESINTKYYKAIRKSETITGLLVAYPDRNVYNIPLERLHMYFNSFMRVRVQHNLEETTFSFPVKLMDRWNKEGEV